MLFTPLPRRTDWQNNGVFVSVSLAREIFLFPVPQSLAEDERDNLPRRCGLSVKRLRIDEGNSEKS